MLEHIDDVAEPDAIAAPGLAALSPAGALDRWSTHPRLRRRDAPAHSAPPWFVVNPNAGGVTHRDVLGAIRRGLGARKATVSSRPPDPGEARAALVVAVGGDGTVSRVINGRLPERLGLIPRGTANDLATELGIPRDFERAWEVLEGGSEVEIDLISVNGARFATGGGLGLATDVAVRANRLKAKPGRWRPLVRWLGPLVYPLATLVEAQGRARRPIQATIRARGVVRRGDVSAILVSNQPRLGRCFTASPSASNRDGLLHLCGLEAPRSCARLLWLCARFCTGRADAQREVFQLRARHVTIETDDHVTFFGDGEPLADGRHFSLEVLPRALRVVVPRPSLAVRRA